MPNMKQFKKVIEDVLEGYRSLKNKDNPEIKIKADELEWVLGEFDYFYAQDVEED